MSALDQHCLGLLEATLRRQRQRELQRLRAVGRAYRSLLEARAEPSRLAIVLQQAQKS